MQVLDTSPPAPRPAQPGRRPRPGDDLPEVPGEGPGPALRARPRRWPTTCAATWRAPDPGPRCHGRGNAPGGGAGATRRWPGCGVGRLLIVAIAIVSSLAAAWLRASRPSGPRVPNATLIERLFHASFAQATASSGQPADRAATRDPQGTVRGGRPRRRVPVSPRDILDMVPRPSPRWRCRTSTWPTNGKGNPPGTNGRGVRLQLPTLCPEQERRRGNGPSGRRTTSPHRFVVMPPGEGPNRGVLLSFSPDDRFLAAYYNDKDGITVP